MLVSKNLIFYITAAITAVKADIVSIQLITKSDTSGIDNVYLTSTHEGAAINYLFLAGTNGGGESFYYDEDKSQVYIPLSSEDTTYHQYFGVSYNIVGLYPDDPDTVSFDSTGKLAINGTTDTFYACHQINDPYRYSYSEYAVVTSPDYTDCEEISIYKVDASESSSSSSPPSTSLSSLTTSTSSISKSSSAPSSVISHSSIEAATSTSVSAIELEGGAQMMDASGSTLGAGFAVLAMMLI